VRTPLGVAMSVLALSTAAWPPRWGCGLGGQAGFQAGVEFAGGGVAQEEDAGGDAEVGAVQFEFALFHDGGGWRGRSSGCSGCGR